MNNISKKSIDFAKNHFFVILFLLFSIMFLARYYQVGYGVGGDGEGYYMYLPSIVLDHDLNFTNQYFETPWMNSNNKYISVSGNLTEVDKNKILQERIGTHGAINIWPIGTAIFLMPFFLFAHLVVLILNVFGLNIITNGYSSVHQIITLLGSIFYGVLGLYLSYLIARKYVKDEIVIKLSIFILAFGSFLIQYISIEPSMSHTVSFFISTLFVYIYLEKIHLKNDGLGWYLIFGLVGGLMICVRQQNFILFLIPMILFAYEIFHKKIKMRKISYLSFSVVMFIIGLMPLLISQQMMYGNPIYSPQTPYIGLSNLNLIGEMFSFKHSLFVSTPLLLISAVGLLLLFHNRNQHWIGITLVMTLFAAIFLNSLITSTGYAFGARRYDDVFFIFVVGFSLLVDKIKNMKIWNILFFIAISSLLILNMMYFVDYNLNIISRGGAVTYFDIIKSFIGLLL